MKIPPKYVDLFLVLVIVVSLTVAVVEFNQPRPVAPAPHTLPKLLATDQLRAEIEQVLQKTHTPGAGIALIERGGSQWIAGVGLADVATRAPVTPDTLFGIGSVSKSFVSLSLLKLAQEGKVALQDTLAARAPDLKFVNPWEATDPVRLVHLLEHTAGWYDLSLRELAYNPPGNPTLREGLDYHPQTRISRWKPGTRYAYSNAGPSVAAYVLEKITGQRFEDYVEENWFKPLGMRTATYFDSPGAPTRRATLYHTDGTTPFPRWHYILRPSSSICASAREMLNYLQFYLNRGSFNGKQLLPPAAIDRIEQPTSTYGAREGLKCGYGLSNHTVIRNQSPWHGHNGKLPGALSELSYSTEAGVGYVVMINSENGKAFSQITGLVQRYLTRKLAKPQLPPPNRASLDLARTYAGWYEPINPQQEFAHFALRILGLTKISVGDAELTVHGLAGGRQSYVAITDRLFRGKSEPFPTLALISDKSEGTLVESWRDTLRRIPAAVVGLELCFVAITGLLMLGSLSFALVWIPRKIFGRMRDAKHFGMRALPLVATLSVCACFALGYVSQEDAITRFGNVTIWSLSFFVLTLVFAGSAVLGLVQAVRLRKQAIPRWLWWHSVATSAALTILAVYLACWGVIGWRTWV